MASSKTARRSTPTAPAGKFQPDATATRIVPLANGACAYVFDPDGKLQHLRVESDAFIAALCTYANALGQDRVLRDLRNANVPAWADVPARLEAALAKPAEG